jgi:KaiC/GvpD/RAD55 family RecA-like ATPase
LTLQITPERFRILQVDRSNRSQIPGLSSLIDKERIPYGLLLLYGPIGSGKSVYCRQFFLDGIAEGDYCIYLSSNLTERQYRNIFSNIHESDLSQKAKFVNPLRYDGGGSEDKLTQTLLSIRNTIEGFRNTKNIAERKGNVRMVVDSLTHMLTIFGEKVMIKFITELSLILHDAEAMAIFTLTVDTTSYSTSSSKNMIYTISSIFDAILEMKINEETNNSIKRNIRLLSIKGVHHNPSWINFDILDNGSIIFSEPSTSQSFVCALCGKSVHGIPIMDSEFTFDTQNCVETYRKLAGVYGPNISEIGLPSEVLNVNFFFIDIVGLSDPSLSVRKQIAKIENLNKMITSCDIFTRGLNEKRIVLPTGDGMAIGFLLNPELPLKLSIQLHQKLRYYNQSKTSHEDSISVRIGISSGPVFIVSDIEGNQNVWGPGIVIARRVMDLGDSMHILLADPLAGQLIGLKDEYRMNIKPILNYEIKHGQKITLYSAYSKEFGNPNLPTRVIGNISKSNTNTAM